MNNKDINDLREQIEEEMMQRLAHIYEQKFDEQSEKIKILEERLRKLEEEFLWAAHELNVL